MAGYAQHQAGNHNKKNPSFAFYKFTLNLDAFIIKEMDNEHDMNPPLSKNNLPYFRSWFTEHLSNVDKRDPLML